MQARNSWLKAVLGEIVAFIDERVYVVEQWFDRRRANATGAKDFWVKKLRGRRKIDFK